MKLFRYRVEVHDYGASSSITLQDSYLDALDYAHIKARERMEYRGYGTFSVEISRKGHQLSSFSISKADDEYYTASVQITPAGEREIDRVKEKWTMDALEAAYLGVGIDATVS